MCAGHYDLELIPAVATSMFIAKQIASPNILARSVQIREAFHIIVREGLRNVLRLLNTSPALVAYRYAAMTTNKRIVVTTFR